MGQAITVTRTERSAEALRDFAAESRDGAQVRRLLALALILEGCSRTEAAKQPGMDRQTLRDGVHRYNEAGILGLLPRKPPSAPAKLSPAQVTELRALVLAGADRETHKVIRRRCVDLRTEFARRFTVTVPERTIGKWLRQRRSSPAAAAHPDAPTVSAA